MKILLLLLVVVRAHDDSGFRAAVKYYTHVANAANESKDAILNYLDQRIPHQSLGNLSSILEPIKADLHERRLTVQKKLHLNLYHTELFKTLQFLNFICFGYLLIVRRTTKSIWMFLILALAIWICQRHYLNHHVELWGQYRSLLHKQALIGAAYTYAKLHATPHPDVFRQALIASRRALKSAIMPF